MGLSAVLDRALAGMLATQGAVDLTARNVANAGAPGYTRKQLVTREGPTGDVLPGQATRQLDAILQRQLRLERSGASYATTLATWLDRLDTFFGKPGGANALDTLFNGFTQSVQALASSPEDFIARGKVVQTAEALASRLNNLSESVQTLRREAERSLAGAVAEANDALARLERVNDQIVHRTGTAAMDPNLLDERDRAIDDLSRLIDIRVLESGDGSVSVFTQSGVLLFDRNAARLEFDERPSLDAHALYSPDPERRGVGTVMLVTTNGGRLDLLRDGALRSGEIGSLIDLRDKALVETQAQLDALAEGMAKALSRRDVAGTPVAGPPAGFDLDVADLQPGDRIGLAFTQDGVTRKVSVLRVDDPSLLPLPPDATADPDDVVIGIDFSGGATAAAVDLLARLQDGLGFAGTLAAAGSVLQVRDDGAGNRTDVLSFGASVTSTALSGQGLALPLFTDGAATPYTGHFEGVSQRLGFAGRIAVNAALADDPSRLVLYGPDAHAGEKTRPEEMLRRLTEATDAFRLDSGTRQPFRGTVGQFAQAVISWNGERTATAGHLKAGQDIVVDALQSRFDEVAGVNVDEEMANLLVLQNAFAANARVMQTVQRMMEDVLNLL